MATKPIECSHGWVGLYLLLLKVKVDKVRKTIILILVTIFSSVIAAASWQVVRRSGETSQYDNPDQHYVTETQMHRNFFKALEEGQARSLSVIATNIQTASIIVA